MSKEQNCIYITNKVVIIQLQEMGKAGNSLKTQIIYIHFSELPEGHVKSFYKRQQNVALGIFTGGGQSKILNRTGS